MSTTVSRTEASTEAAAELHEPREATARGGRSLRLPTMAGLIVIAAVAALWGLSGRSGGGDGGADLFTVSRRSFPVLLREKGELKAAKSVDIKSEVEGRSTIIWLIEEGVEVKKGDLLVKLASDQIDDRVQSEEIKEANSAAAAEAAVKEHEILIDQNASDQRKAELALEMALIEKEKYFKGDWEQTKLDMQLELDRAKKVQQRAQAELVDSKDLYQKGFITEGDLYRDELAEMEADIAVKKAELNKEITQKYTHNKDLQQRESDVEEARKELERVKKSNAAKEAKSLAERDAKQAEWALTKERLAKFREQQAKCEMRAPQDGLVVYETGGQRWDRRQIAEGAEVYERQTIIKLPDPSVMVVTVRIHEAKTNKIAMGQQATVEVEGIPGQVFTGKVTKIAALADSQNMWLNPDLKEYETEITLDRTDAALKPGVTARADIVVTELDNVLAVPIQTVFSKAGHHFVFRKKGGDVEPVEVEVGLSSDEYVEIMSGLAEGDRVLLAVPEAVRQTLPEVEPRFAQGNGQNGADKAPGEDRPRPSADQPRQQSPSQQGRQPGSGGRPRGGGGRSRGEGGRRG